MHLIHLGLILPYVVLQLFLKLEDQLVISQDLHFQRIDSNIEGLLLFQAQLVFLFVRFVLLGEVVVGREQFLDLAVQLHDVCF